MSSSTCSTPLSWLVLERYQLGELPPSEHDSVTKHLSTCDECASVLTRIADDDRELAPLAPSKAPAKVIRLFAPRTIAIAGGLALAAAIVFVVGRLPRDDNDNNNNNSDRMKGADVAFSLVREDSALVPEAGGPYRDGERFKALVTCPPGMKASFDLVVYEHGVASFPLAAQSDFPCGNSTPLAGAFRVSGHERMTVCLTWSAASSASDREVVRRLSPDVLTIGSSTMHAQCTNLDPVP